jgi:hypothetical protein
MPDDRVVDVEVPIVVVDDLTTLEQIVQDTLRQILRWLWFSFGDNGVRAISYGSELLPSTIGVTKASDPLQVPFRPFVGGSGVCRGRPSWLSEA